MEREIYKALNQKTNLLCLQNAKGYLCYVDVSIGLKVTGFTTGLGRIDVMCQNPTNAIIHLGHSGGRCKFCFPGKCYTFVHPRHVCHF